MPVLEGAVVTGCQWSAVADKTAVADKRKTYDILFDIIRNPGGVSKVRARSDYIGTASNFSALEESRIYNEKNADYRY